MAEKKRVCVTGGGGYIASWLIKFLLSKDYIVHATIRIPESENNAHLMSLEKASENLRLFKAELLDYDALFHAIEECKGVFHVACPVQPDTVPNPEREIFEPTVTGTSNVLKACSMANVSRVVMVSSMAAVVFNPNWPKDQPMDESCWSDKETCKTGQYNCNWYSLSKTIAESQALEYGKRTGLDVVTICPSMIIGPMLQSRMTFGSCHIYRILKGNELESNSWPLVDVRDVAEALLLVYEKPEAEGRYICSSYTVRVPDLVDKLKSLYPQYNYTKLDTGIDKDERDITSDKLQKLGWRYRSLEQSIVDTVKIYQERGILE